MKACGGEGISREGLRGWGFTCGVGWEAGGEREAVWGRGGGGGGGVGGWRCEGCLGGGRWGLVGMVGCS